MIYSTNIYWYSLGVKRVSVNNKAAKSSYLHGAYILVVEDKDKIAKQVKYVAC
jgi:hypothetical protein